MNTATLTIITLLACGLALATVWAYEKALREERWRRQRAEEHAETCQHLVATMSRHPAGKRISADLHIVSGDAS